MAAVVTIVVALLGVLLPALTSIEGEAGAWLDDVTAHLDHPLQRIAIVGYRVDGADAGAPTDVPADALACTEPFDVVGYGPFWLPVSTVEVRCGRLTTVAGL